MCVGGCVCMCSVSFHVCMWVCTGVCGCVSVHVYSYACTCWCMWVYILASQCWHWWHTKVNVFNLFCFLTTFYLQTEENMVTIECSTVKAWTVLHLGHWQRAYWTWKPFCWQLFPDLNLMTYKIGLSSDHYYLTSHYIFFCQESDVICCLRGIRCTAMAGSCSR